MAVDLEGIRTQPEPVTQATRLRIKVVDHNREGRPAVNVDLPIGLVRWGLKMARNFSPELKDADLDWDAVSAMVAEGGRGEIVHVEDERENKSIEVWVE